MFDANPEKHGQKISGTEVLPAEQIAEVCRTRNVSIGVICVPARAAQQVADQYVRAGVKAIWNFAPARIEVPPDVEVRQENLTVGLLALSFYLAQRDD